MKIIFSAVMIVNLGVGFAAAAELPADEFNLAGLTAESLKAGELIGLAVPAVPNAAAPSRASVAAGTSLHDAVNAMIDAEMEAYLNINEVVPEIVKGYYYEYSQYTNGKKHVDAAMAAALVSLKTTGAELDKISGLLKSAADGSAGNIGDIYVEGGMFDISEIYLSRCERDIAKILASGRKRPEIINGIDTELKQVRAKYKAVASILRELGELNKPVRAK